jgi:hypothetical protein
VLPPHERFDPLDPPGGDIEYRLVGETELAAVDCSLQIGGERQSLRVGLL